MASRIEQHIQDDCLTAEQVRVRAYEAFQWHRKAFEVPKAIVPPPIVKIAPVVIIEAPKPETLRDWLYCNAAISRADKWPSTFIKHIKSLVSKEFDIPVIEIDSHRRAPMYVIPRHIAFYLCRVLTLKSTPEIGHRFGGRDHTTILHGVSATERRMKESKAFCEVVIDLKLKLEADLAEWRASV